MPTILWNWESKITLGLSLLHGRLAFNSIWLSIASTFNLPELRLAPVFFQNAVLSVFFISYLIESVRFSEDKSSIANIFALFCILFFALPSVQFSETMGSLQTDSASSIFVLLAIHAALRLFDYEKKKEESEPILLKSLFFLFLFSFLAITIKLSQAAIILFPLVSLLIFKEPLRKLADSTKLVIIGIFVWSSVVWVLRSLFLSGCMFFPISQSCVFFRPESASVAEVERRAVEAWAKVEGANPDLVLGNWNWLPGWTSDFLGSRMVQLSAGLAFLGILLAFVGLLFFKSSKGMKENRWMGVLLLLGLILCNLSWFFTAPAVRFGYGFILGLGVVVFCLGLSFFPVLVESINKHRLKFQWLAIALIAFLPGYLKGAWNSLSEHKVWPNVPIVEYRTQMQFGVEYQIPKENDQCWMSPLPCAPSVRPDLQYFRSEFWPKFELKK